MTDDIATATVATGSTSERTAAAGSSQPWRGNPPGGRTPASSAKTHTRITPTQKTGTATPSWDTAETATPTTPRRRTAATTPSGTDTSTETTKAARLRGSVIGSLLAISSPTGRRETNDVPALPENSPATHCPYCVHRGWSVPRSARSWSSWSLVVPTPSDVPALSPGRNRRTAKTTTLARTNDSSSVPTRVRR